MRRHVLALVLLGAALLLAGCGASGGEEVTGQSGADTNNGKTLFIQKCASCHALADAGTIAQVGPNLDDAFGFACKQGFGEDTFFDVVRSQIDLAAPPMPADIVEGQDAVDVAAYVADAAGKKVAGCGGATTTGGTTTTGETGTGAQTTTGAETTPPSS